MTDHADIVGGLPFPLSIDFHLFLTMDHLVMDNAGKLELVGLGSVRVENDILVLQPFVG